MQTSPRNLETAMASHHYATTTNERKLEEIATTFLRRHGINANGLRSTGKDGGKQYAFERRLLSSATGRMTNWKR